MTRCSMHAGTHLRCVLALSTLNTLALAILANVTPVAAQPSKAVPSAVGAASATIGILPFLDATASGNRDVGTTLGLTMLGEIGHATALKARALSLDEGVRPEQLDGDGAVAIGRKQGVTVVFVGTVLEAKTEQSSKSGWLPRIKGNNVNLTLHSLKATVTLQGELYEVASGQQISSVRVTGKNSNNKFEGRVWTSLGSWDAGSSGAFLASPLGKALQQAIAEMVKKVAATPLPATAQHVGRKGP